jgi:hypothetical protein
VLVLGFQAIQKAKQRAGISGILLQISVKNSLRSLVGNDADPQPRRASHRTGPKPALAAKTMIMKAANPI